MIVTLADAKVQLSVDGDSHDDLIEALIGAATLQVSAWIERPIYASAGDLPDEGSENYSPVQIVADQAIQVAIMQLITRMFDARGGEGDNTGDAVPPMSVRALLASYRVFADQKGA